MKRAASNVGQVRGRLILWKNLYFSTLHPRGRGRGHQRASEEQDLHRIGKDTKYTTLLDIMLDVDRRMRVMQVVECGKQDASRSRRSSGTRLTSLDAKMKIFQRNSGWTAKRKGQLLTAPKPRDKTPEQAGKQLLANL